MVDVAHFLWSEFRMIDRIGVHHRLMHTDVTIRAKLGKKSTYKLDDAALVAL